MSDSYSLSRKFFDWAFENPEKVSPNHVAIYFFAIEHCNRLGWKVKFGFPTQMAMDALGIKKYGTYIKYFNELVEWGFIDLVQKSKNQYSANIISLSFALPKNGKALDKAFINHAAKQTEKQPESNGQSTRQSNSTINKQVNKEQDNQEQINNGAKAPMSEFEKTLDEFYSMRRKIKKPATPHAQELILKELNKLAPNDEGMKIAILNQSIRNSWQDVWPLKTDTKQTKPQGTGITGDLSQMDYTL